MNIEEILKNMEDVAANAALCKYRSPAQYALLRGVAAIKHLQGEKLIADADRLLHQVTGTP